MKPEQTPSINGIGPSFIFIPDISGFTNFVNDTEISHSRHIITELLEIILNSNRLDLKPTEIEGDAVMFYRENVPGIDDIFDQARKMYINFHHHLRKYEILRICQCGACRTAASLSLKFIAHSGPVSFIDVEKFHKPFGKALITAHRLLKNSIPGSEYLLMTDDLINLWKPDYKKGLDLKFSYGEDTTIGISYRFIPLTFLNTFIPPVEHFIIPQKTSNPVRHEFIINRPMEEIYPLLMDLEFKKKWNREIDDIHYEENIVNRSGFSHTCIVNKKELNFKTITNDFGSEKWVYGEKLKNPPFVEEADFYYILEKMNTSSTLLRFELHYKPGRGMLKLLSIFFRMMMGRMYIRNLIFFKRIIETGG